MKGLIRNNFYMVSGSMHLTIILSIVGIVIGALTNKMIVSAVIGGQLGGFGALAATAIQKDATSKWCRFELTLPIKRTDVIKARYISFLLFISIGLVLAVITAIVHIVTLDITTGAVADYERLSYAFTFGVAFALSIPTFLVPLILIFGVDKNEILLFISVGIGMALFVGASAIVGLVLPAQYNTNLIFRTTYLLFSIIMLIISYFVSLQVYKRKEM